MAKWAKHFSPRKGNKIEILVEPDFDYLSQREIEALEQGFHEITSLVKEHGKIDEVLHQKWPEWKNPQKVCGKLSMPLEIEEILSEFLCEDDEIEKISLEIESVQSAKAALQAN